MLQLGDVTLNGYGMGENLTIIQENMTLIELNKTEGFNTNVDFSDSTQS